MSNNKNPLFYIFGCGCIFFAVFSLCIVPCLCISVFIGSLSSASSSLSQNGVNESVIYGTDENSYTENLNLVDKIAVVNILDTISYSRGDSSVIETGATSNNIIRQLQKAKDDEKVKAVILRFNSGGGEVDAAEPICNAIKEVDAEKPVYSFIDSSGASLAYLLPNCSRYIYSRPSAITGSIGVIIQAFDYYGILEKVGGKVVFITNTEGANKSGQDIFVEGSETYRIYQQILDETYSYFINKIYEGRDKKLSIEQIKSYADGRIFSGKQAKDIGLVDELGEFNTVLDSIADKENLDLDDINVVEYTQTENPFSNIFFGLNSAIDSANLKNQVEKTDRSMKLMMVVK